MPNTITPFDSTKHHIHVEFFVTDRSGVKRAFDGVIDTGAPRTEFNDLFLIYAGLLPPNAGKDIVIKNDLQSQKYGKIILPKIEICGHILRDYEVMVAKLDESWGIAALIGLDFFRHFEVTINFKKGQITAAPL